MPNFLIYIINLKQILHANLGTKERGGKAENELIYHTWVPNGVLDSSLSFCTNSHRTRKFETVNTIKNWITRQPLPSVGNFTFKTWWQQRIIFSCFEVLNSITSGKEATTMELFGNGRSRKTQIIPQFLNDFVTGPFFFTFYRDKPNSLRLFDDFKFLIQYAHLCDSPLKTNSEVRAWNEYGMLTLLASFL